MIILVMIDLNLRTPSDHFSDGLTERAEYKELKNAVPASKLCVAAYFRLKGFNLTGTY
jgi:hypothetical protein